MDDNGTKARFVLTKISYVTNKYNALFENVVKRKIKRLQVKHIRDNGSVQQHSYFKIKTFFTFKDCVLRTTKDLDAIIAHLILFKERCLHFSFVSSALLWTLNDNKLQQKHHVNETSCELPTSTRMEWSDKLLFFSFSL